MKNCIVSVAFREKYVEHSLVQENQLRIFYDVAYLAFRDQLPTRNGIVTEDIVTEFQKSLYGFKPHAIQRAIDLGYKKIVWFDPSVLPTASVYELFRSLDKHPMIVRTGSHPLKNMVNKKALDWFEVTEEEIEGVNHIGGTVYAFNFDYPKVRECFNLWKEAEEDGIFGTQDEFMVGHWADEACMALAMFKTGIPQYWEGQFTYQNQKELDAVVIGKKDTGRFEDK